MNESKLLSYVGQYESASTKLYRFICLFSRYQVFFSILLTGIICSTEFACSLLTNLFKIKKLFQNCTLKQVFMYTFFNAHTYIYNLRYMVQKT